MVEMLNLKASSMIELDYSQLDSMVQDFYGVTYSTLNSSDDIHNDTYLKYSLIDFEDVSKNMDEYLADYVAENASDLQRWKDSDCETLEGVDEFMRVRDEMFHPHWTIMLTLLIMEGRIPQADYLIEISW